MIQQRNKPTFVAMICEALQSLDDDLRRILTLYHGCVDRPGLSFEEIAHQLDRPVRDIIKGEKAAIRPGLYLCIAPWLTVLARRQNSPIEKNYKNRGIEVGQIAPIISDLPDFVQMAPTLYALRNSDGNPDRRLVCTK